MRIFDICRTRKGNGQVPLNEGVEKVQSDMGRTEIQSDEYLQEVLSDIFGVRSARSHFQVSCRERMAAMPAEQISHGTYYMHETCHDPAFRCPRAEWVLGSFEFREYPTFEVSVGFRASDIASNHQSCN